MIIDDIKMRLKNLQNKFSDCYAAVGVAELQRRKAELDALQADPDLYKNLKRAQSVNSEAKFVSEKLSLAAALKSRLAETAEFITLAEDEDDDALLSDVEKGLSALEADVEKLYLSTLLKGEYDKNNAVLTLHAGAGGTEAQDWVQMLYRMYKMYAAAEGFTVGELDYLAGDEAGIKSVTFTVRGLNAYGYLKAEKGVHRLVRISPFDSNARRHTSFASLEVAPEIEDEGAIEVSPDELKIDTYRSGGAGGQHVNTTDSAVRITHLPTGIVAQCQNERSQLQNRETAMKMLLGKLVEKREREQAEKAKTNQEGLKKIEWGSQIRSYVFQPYTMVKDHRTGFETPDVAAVMNGKISGFIFDYLKKS
ncbi:MAG: peptide chain release factor 2 [Clostridiales bacterium]|jgi:peptide chain release factor 2|nr:peptide chain release factor 2 [Clostridiales bacterium]